MSENLDLVRSIYAAWERGDFSRTDWADPEIEYVFTGGPEPGSRTGLTGMAEGWRQWLSAWEDYRVEADEYRELDEERVLVLSRLGGHGKASGLPLGQIRLEGTELFQLRAERVVRLVIYWDRERAFADLGLAREGGSQR